MPADYFRLRQVCLVAPALEPVARAFDEVFGLAMCFQDEHVAKYGLVNGLFPVGTDFLEVVVPTREGTAAGRFLEATGGRGGYMAIFDCSDPEPRAENARRLGVRIANEIRHDGYRGWQLHPKDCRAAMIEFDRSEGADDPRGAYHPAGGRDWVRHVRDDVTLRMTSITLRSPRPDDLAAHWSRLLQRELRDGRIATDAMAIRFEAGPADGRESLARIAMQVRRPDEVIDAARSRALPVEGRSVFVAGVWFDAVGAD